MVNFGFDDNKTKFDTNDSFQVYLDKKISKEAIKEISSQGKIKKKEKTSKRRGIKTYYLGSFCKVASALGSYYITFFYWST